MGICSTMRSDQIYSLVNQGPPKRSGKMLKYVYTHAHLFVISFSFGAFNDEIFTVFLFQTSYVIEDLITNFKEKT